ncbi:hypothetical protein [Deinococcus aerophilus]|uniref:EamA family transporter n=1 Tax=Deinococcus aerophilus TaxID=522488 RepID=A0ABQ2GVK9_9DEIO|nr:hypothetical protein [Deinococcus aerophilus]GGM14002.1 hypothetical protein GCM10010841_23270 [Deinococcus aerophilus]
MRGKRIGALIGALGGLLFVLINTGAFPVQFAVPVRGLGTLAFVFVLWRTVLRPPPQTIAETPPSPTARRVYWNCVLAGALSIPIGANLLNRVLPLPQLTVLWVIFVVGARFLPFTRAFAAPVFKPLAWVLMGLAATGAALTLTVWPAAPGSIAVLAGFALLGFSASGTVKRSGLLLD